MSHESGKIEVVGMTQDQIFFKYARSANPEDNARFLAFFRDPNAAWFDDYKEAIDLFESNMDKFLSPLPWKLSLQVQGGFVGGTWPIF